MSSSSRVSRLNSNVKMTVVASLCSISYSTVYLDADQRKHQSSASLAFVRGSHRGPVNSPHKWPVTRKMFPFDDVIMRYTEAYNAYFLCNCSHMDPVVPIDNKSILFQVMA